MRHNYQHYHLHEREHHPRVAVGIFFIVLGLALLVASNDLLDLGSFRSYFTWETVLIFIGILLLLNLRFTEGVLFIAGGTWFLLDDIFIETPDIIKTVYWPSVIVLIGLSFIMSSVVKRIKRNHKNLNQ
jgi:hypothetical protein